VKVLVDTSVWSLALRRTQQKERSEAAELRRLIADQRVEIIGPIRQEILSGIPEPSHFENLEERLSAFPDVPIRTEDYVTAAKFFNRCRSKGIQGANTDFLICAVAARNEFAIFTTDKDFALFAKCLPIVLHKADEEVK
jgi:predicted nucleic acid-binding protein